jgi:hypothetical protein
MEMIERQGIWKRRMVVSFMAAVLVVGASFLYAGVLLVFPLLAGVPILAGVPLYEQVFHLLVPSSPSFPKGGGRERGRRE